MTIRELIKKNGNQPMWVWDGDEEAPCYLFVVGISPTGDAVGWNQKGNADNWPADRSLRWTEAPSPVPMSPLIPKEIVT
jgi:hypothetical protein